ncbi:phage major capsid protein [Metabacillus indicus]|uniref:Phage major capsid protein n=1 Tax=Metabacillus indicus TaxID=246786 RepID=A0A084GIL3_METID|nr:phage major capsid protein [Metabacillus indicus]KEZ47175.1 hypothetical protein GS18_0220205 [Metabacillus indicus]
MELRSNKVTLVADDQGLFVRGYVNKPGQLSQLLGTTKKFKERIQPGAFQSAIESRSRPIDFLAEHKPEAVLASTRNESLVLREDSDGLYMEARISPTTYGKDYYTLISDGLIQSMSFGFRALKESWQHVNGLAIRTIEQLELFEVSAVKEPAYLQSTISARNINLIEKIEVPTEDLHKEERGTNMQKIEKRTTNGLAAIIKNETRALQTTADGASLIPEQTHNEIVLKMEEISPVFARVRKLGSVAGTLRVARENDALEAGFVGEGNNIIEGALGFSHVDLQQKRVGAALTLSKQLINDAATNVEDYAKNLLARRTVKAIEKSILTGNGGVEFNGVINDADVAKVEASGVVTTEKLAELYLAVHPEFLTGASFIMQRDFFNQIAKLKDNNGHFFIQNGIVNGKLQHTLLGMPIDVTESLPATTPVVFGNVTEAVSLMIKKDFGLQEIADGQQALRGSLLFVFDAYMDSAVVNPQALAKLVLV